MLSKEACSSLKKLNVGYVGISLDGIGSRHDEFRRSKSFDRALNGLRNCRESGQKVGLRFTINNHNYNQLEDIFRLLRKKKYQEFAFII